MHVIGTRDLRGWIEAQGAGALGSIGRKRVDPEYAEQVLGMPLHLRFTLERLAEEAGGADRVDPDALTSIPFYSLCSGLFLPLSMLQPERARFLFGLETKPPPDARAREELFAELIGKDIGLSQAQKLSCVLGDPFRGRPATLRRDSLIHLLRQVMLVSRRDLLQRLTEVGDVAALFAESRPTLRTGRGLTAAEVLEALRFIPEARRTTKLRVLRSLLDRMGKLEAYFLAKLVLRKAGFGFDYQGPLIARVLAEQYGAEAEHIAHAMALTDAFHVMEALDEEGPAGLRRIRLQPLVPVRPALASGSTDGIKDFPVWVERKYDGIRIMLHKSTDARGSVLAGAYTRTRGDWLEMIQGLEQTIPVIPAHSAIIDGELYGTVIKLDGARPATVYEVYGSLQGDSATPVAKRFAAFDILYLNGEDLTGYPLAERRRRLKLLLAPLAGVATPIPVTLADGQLAESAADVNRLYQHFRAQGYEGVVTKDLQGPYRLATRDPSWLKKKPEITLDLVLLGAVLAVTTKEKAGMFGSYVIGARTDEGHYEDLGDVAGVDQVRDRQIQAEIMREGLLTGRRIERKSASGVRPGLELRPHIVVTVRFEGVVRDGVTGSLSLRDPKLVVIRSDKSPLEADTKQAIEEAYLRQRVG